VVWESKDLTMKPLPPGVYKATFAGHAVDEYPLFCLRATAEIDPPSSPLAAASYSGCGKVYDGVAFRVQEA
jgi:hypothetical protein